jgi:hypothetical protein
MRLTLTEAYAVLAALSYALAGASGDRVAVLRAARAKVEYWITQQERKP